MKGRELLGSVGYSFHRKCVISEQLIATISLQKEGKKYVESGEYACSYRGKKGHKKIFVFSNHFPNVTKGIIHQSCTFVCRNTGPCTCTSIYTRFCTLTPSSCVNMLAAGRQATARR